MKNVLHALMILMLTCLLAVPLTFCNNERCEGEHCPEYEEWTGEPKTDTVNLRKADL